MKPGDVVGSLDGKTIEVLNTDAEGRLLLADALSYVRRFEPGLVIDVATLTGAAAVALGRSFTALFTDDEMLAEALLRAGLAAQDPCWRLPMTAGVPKALQSPFADIANTAGRVGGAMNAAMFLRSFVVDQRWAHLDCGGTAWRQHDDKGATGRPVALLAHFLRDAGLARERAVNDPVLAIAAMEV